MRQPAAAVDGQNLHLELEARSLVVAAETRAVLAIRRMCSAGSEWGAEGTVSQMLRVDVQASTVTVLSEFPAVVPGQPVELALGVAFAGASSDGAYVVIAEPYSLHGARYQVHRAESPATLEELAITCELGRDIVGLPTFVGQDTVVVVSRCALPDDGARPRLGYDAATTGELRVGAVPLSSNGVVWRGRLPTVEHSAYTGTVSLHAQRDATGELWALVSGSDDIIKPTRGAPTRPGGSRRPNPTYWAGPSLPTLCSRDFVERPSEQAFAVYRRSRAIPLSA